MILQVLYHPNDSVILWLLVIWHLSELFKKVHQSQMHMLFILHVKWLVNCKRKSSVGMKCQEQCGLCRKSLSCILNSKDRKVLNRWWLTVYSLPAAPNGKGSLRYTKQNAQPEVLAAPDVWVFRLIICIAIHIKLVLSGEKKKRRQKWTLITLHQSDTGVGHQQGQIMFSLLLRHAELSWWHSQQCVSLYASPAPTTHDCSLCSGFPAWALILREAQRRIPCCCNNPVAGL